MGQLLLHEIHSREHVQCDYDMGDALFMQLLPI